MEPLTKEKYEFALARAAQVIEALGDDPAQPIMEQVAVTIARALLQADPDARRLDWYEAQHTLHWSLELLYVVDGYELSRSYDNNTPSDTWHGDTMRAAIDRALSESAKGDDRAG